MESGRSDRVATFEDPVNQPHLTPDAASGYSVLCGGHSFLSDGRLLVVGGGGYGPHAKAMWGYKFDPTSRTWARTAGSMVHNRWYPTVLTLGDQRIGDSHEVLVVCGHGAGDMEIYDEATDSFREVTSPATTSRSRTSTRVCICCRTAACSIREPAGRAPARAAARSSATTSRPTLS